MATEWRPVAEEGIRGFLQFQEKMLALEKEDPRWAVQLIDVEQAYGSQLIRARFYETPQAAKIAGSHQAIEVSVFMKKFTSAGELWMKGNETWEFGRSEKVGNEVASILTPLLEQSGLSPMVMIERQQEGRASHWFTSWNLYPSNHPKVIEQRSRNTSA